MTQTFLVMVECVKKEWSWLGGRKMWLSLFTICLAIAICLGVAATMSAVNKPG